MIDLAGASKNQRLSLRDIRLALAMQHRQDFRPCHLVLIPIFVRDRCIRVRQRGIECDLFAEQTQIPVAWTLLGIGAIDETHPLAYGYMGMHGWKHVNRAIQTADLLIAIGMRFDDRVTGNVRTYAPYARIVHADIDPAEISKNRMADVPIVGDCKEVILQLTAAVQGEYDAGHRAETTSPPLPAGRRTSRRTAARCRAGRSAGGL